VSPPTIADVKRWLLCLLPPGATESLYSTADGDGGTGDYFGALAEGVKTYGTDLVETLRTNVDPNTVTDKLSDWEGANGTSATKISQYGSDAERQDQLVSRFRENGSSFLDNVRATVQSYFKYDDPSLIQIIECDRSALSTAHTYGWTADVIPALGNYDKSVFVTDQTYVSDAGAVVWVNITIAAVEDLTIAIETPGGTPFTLAAGTLGTGAVTNQQYQFWVAGCAGEDINGNWRLIVSNAGAGAGTVNVNAGAGRRTDMFVEGIGRVVFSDVQGLGNSQFLYAVVFDPSLSATSTPDLAACRAALRRITPGHCQGFVVQVMSGGGLCCVVDDASAIVSGCVVC
jgi:hypothetical protein